MLSLCPFDISVGVWAFVKGLSQISSFFSETFDDSFEDTVKKYIIELNCCNIFLYTHGYVTMSDLTDTLSCIV